MGNLIKIDIEVARNNVFVVTHYKTEKPSLLLSLQGVKQQVDKLAFQNSKELVEWIEKVQ